MSYILSIIEIEHNIIEIIIIIIIEIYCRNNNATEIIENFLLKLCKFNFIK